VARRFKAGFIYLQEVLRKVSGSSQSAQRFTTAKQKVLESKYRNLKVPSTYLTKLNTADLHLCTPLSHTTQKKQKFQLDLEGQLKQTGCQFFHIVSRISIGRPHIPESIDWFPVSQVLSLSSTFRVSGSAAQNIPATQGPFRRPASSFWLFSA
jgi:hypothetical protein